MLLKSLIVIFLLLLSPLQRKLQPPTLSIDRQEAALNLNQNFLQYISIGFKNFLADMIWVKTLLDSDIDHYKNKDLNSWMYLRFKTIAHLDPLFRFNYIYGSMYLSIIKDDKIGTIELLKTALKHYPDDSFINQFCLFHTTQEYLELELAQQCQEKIINDPKVESHIKMLLVNRLKGTDNKEFAIEFMRRTAQITQDEKIRKRIERKIQEIINK
jgi:hypothetical protein